MPNRQSRNVSLTSELESFITASLESGDYGNASEVVRSALKLLRDSGRRPRGQATLWPAGSGECVELIRGRDWSKTPLGPMMDWSPELRATVANVVNSPIPKVLMWGPAHIMLYNDAYSAIAGPRHPEALGGSVPEMWPEIWDWNKRILEAGFRGETLSYRDQAMTLMRTGVSEEVMFDLFYTPIYEDSGEVGGVMCTVLENTDRVAMQRAIARSEGELRALANALPALVAYIDQDLIYRFANAEYENWVGLKPDEVIGRHVHDVLGVEVYEERKALLDRALAGETIVADSFLPHRDGTDHRAALHYIPRIAPDGQVLGFQAILFDIEERLQHVDAVAASNARFRAAMDAIHGVLWTNDATGRMVGEQPGWEKLTGQKEQEYQGYGWVDAVHPDDRQPSIASWEAAVAAKTVYVFEHRIRHHSGSWRTFAVRAVPTYDIKGDVIEWIGVHTDITHQRAAEAALKQHGEDLERQVHHRERAEAQLRELNENLETRVIQEIGNRRNAETALAQAQKMETLGKLTGGVAHDFNNLLQVISGNLQLLIKDVNGNAKAERRVTNAMAGVSRGAKLASQLLAFGRRQPLEPKVVNATRFVREMDDMLRRAIGEAIEIETVVAGGLWNSFIDPVQMENAVLNLAINARDAMNGQGRLTIELGNAHLDDEYARSHSEVAAGQYVVLAVTDTGCGMDADTMTKAFEPFFSTKGEGKGSGLGLSMVYGFVKQSGGHIKIYSEIGQGTTIRLYLPRSFDSEDIEVATDLGPISGGTETVLVVEDDDEVRATVVELLSELGYRVLKAVDAQSALNVIESGIPIDILFTDVVMPGALKSPELARKAKERLPNLAVLFTSGYTENSIVHGGRLDAGVELLSKPYTREALARKFRHVIANQRQITEFSALPDSPVQTQDGQRLTVLLVEDEPVIRELTAETLQAAGFLVVEASSAEDAIAALQTAPIDVLVTDVHLPGASGIELARITREIRPEAGIVYATGDAAVALVDAAHEAVLSKPYDADRLLGAIRKVCGLSMPTGLKRSSGELEGESE